jgi:hypothetical protein
MHAPVLVTQPPSSTGNLCPELTQASGTSKERPTHCPGIERRGSGGWAWAKATTTFQTLQASSRAPPSSAAGIPLDPPRTAGEATNQGWTMQNAPPSHSLRSTHDPTPASTSASTPASYHGEPLPLPLLCFSRLHLGQHTCG